jgi:hypothetical protein
MVLTNLLMALYGCNLAAAAPLDLCAEVPEAFTNFVWSTTDITYTITVIPTSSPAIEVATQQTNQPNHPLSETSSFETQESGFLPPTYLDSNPTTSLAQSQSPNLYSLHTTSPFNHDGSGHGYNGPCSESNPCNGDVTFYDAATDAFSPSACGVTNNGESDLVLALPQGIMTRAECGRAVHINYKGKRHTGVVVDKCTGCDNQSIDVSRALFQKLSSLEEGRLFGVNWYIG